MMPVYLHYIYIFLAPRILQSVGIIIVCIILYIVTPALPLLQPADSQFSPGQGRAVLGTAGYRLLHHQSPLNYTYTYRCCGYKHIEHQQQSEYKGDLVIWSVDVLICTF